MYRFKKYEVGSTKLANFLPRTSYFLLPTSSLYLVTDTKLLSCF